MEGSWLQETLQIIYAQNFIQYIISGKAYSRAIRRNILIDWALNIFLFTELYDSEDGADSADTEKIFSASGKLMKFFTAKGHTDMQSIDENVSLVEVAKNYFLLLNSHFPKGRVRQNFWYWNDRHTEEFYPSRAYGELGQAVEAMLPYLAAPNHFINAKSARVYLQNVKQLKTTNPDVFDNFQNGRYVLHIPRIFKAVQSLYLVIEQVLMHSLKTKGGLTRGSGMDE